MEGISNQAGFKVCDTSCVVLDMKSVTCMDDPDSILEGAFSAHEIDVQACVLIFTARVDESGQQLSVL